MADPVAWKVIEHGWDVVAADGTHVGTVAEVVGDSTADIFNGVVVSPGFLRGNRYVAAEDVAEIVDGEVRLAFAGAAFEDAQEWQGAPPSLDVLKPDPER